jgi:LCP family protein required for cell wall assembly
MASTPPTPRSGGGKRLLLAITASLALVLSIGAGVGYRSYLWAQGQFPSVKSEPLPGGTEGAPPTIDPVCDQHACNYLLLGSDSRTGLSREDELISGTNADLGGEQRSDTIILVHVPAGEQKAVILSFPRDLWVDVPGRGMDKINSAFEGGLRGGGPDRVARTVEEFTGLNVNHFLYVNLAGFQGVVDALDGVDMCVPYPMQDPLTGLDIQAGCQRFDGRTALAYVRTRHQVCDAVPDFARIARQQQFLRALLAKMLAPGQITKLPGLVKPVAENLVKDSRFELADMYALVQTLGGISTGDAEFRSVPGVPSLLETPDFPSGISVVEPTPQADNLFEALREGRPLPANVGEEQSQTEISEANVSVVVYDKSGGDQAQTVVDVLGRSGFNNDAGLRPAADLSADVKGSAILFEKGNEARAQTAAKYFPELPLEQVPKGTLPTDVALVVTSGFDPDQVGSTEAPTDFSDCPQYAGAA